MTAGWLHRGGARKIRSMAGLGKDLWCIALVLFCLFPQPEAIWGMGGGSRQSADVVCHIIPHSHCDPGWLDTFEDYYTKQVESVLTNVVHEVSQKPHRRFVWSETSFLKRWFEEQPDSVRAQVRKLISSGQIELVNGGWSQNDEAIPDYVAIMNQMTEGHEYLYRQFGVYPEVGWQIDPFGHSNVMSFLASLFGFKALFINRIHTNLKLQFKKSQHMEFMWDVEDTDFHTSIFTHVLHTHYSAPKGYDWEENAATVSAKNIDGMSRRLCDTLSARAAHYRSGHIFVPFGDDFKFQAAGRQFSNMDKLIEYINDHDDIPCHMRYSTPSEYLQAVKDADITVPEFEGDFYPYADNEDSYWTGYYSTRPVLKQQGRRVEAFKRSAEILGVLAHESPTVEWTSGREEAWAAAMAQLGYTREQTALFLHHDAITGTAKPNVVEDYISRMTQASKHCQQLTGWFLTMLLEKQWRDDYDELTLKPSQLALGASVVVQSKEEVHPVVLFNSLAWPRKQVVSIRVSSRVVTVLNCEMEEIKFQLDRVFPNFEASVPKNDEFEVHFIAEMPPLGIGTYYVKVGGTASALMTTAKTLVIGGSRSNSMRGGGQHEDVEVTSAFESPRLENKFMRVVINAENGLIDHLVVDPAGAAEKVDLGQMFTMYSSSRSGAYLMRTDGFSTPIDSHGDKFAPAFIRVTKGEVMQTVTTRYDQFDVKISLVSCEDPELGDHVKFEASVVATNGFETVLEFNTNVRGRDSFHTHTGRMFMERGVVDVEDKKAGKAFYPSVGGVLMKDASPEDATGAAPSGVDRSFMVVQSHTMATASRKEGLLEFVVHRWLKKDDGRGLGEGVHDGSRVNLPFWIMPGRDTESSRFRRRSLQMNFPVEVYGTNGVPYSAEQWRARFESSFSGMTAALDDEVHLLSFYARDLASDDVVLRLEQLSQTDKNQGISRDLFRGLRLQGIRPVKLSLMSGQQTKNRMQFKSSADAANGVNVQVGSSDGDNQNTEEEGVFVSQAAVDKKNEEGTPGRVLLEAETEKVTPVSVPITSFLTLLDPIVDAGEDEIEQQQQQVVAPVVDAREPEIPPVDDVGVDTGGEDDLRPEHGPEDQLPPVVDHVKHTDVPDGMPGKKPAIVDIVPPVRVPPVPVPPPVAEPMPKVSPRDADKVLQGPSFGPQAPHLSDQHGGGGGGGKNDFKHLRVDATPAREDYLLVMGITFLALLFMLFRGVGCTCASGAAGTTDEFESALKMN